MRSAYAADYMSGRWGEWMAIRCEGQTERSEESGSGKVRAHFSQALC